QFTLKERVELGNGEAPMLRAEEVWGEVRLEDVRAMTDAVEAEGVLVADILYYCEDDTDPVCMVQRGIPFMQMMELKGVNEGDDANVRIRLDDMDFQMLSETEGELRATMTMESTVRREETAEAVTDIILLDEPEERTSSAGAVIYMVQPGDTLWSIAKEYETTIEDILAVNDIENPALIYPDQKLLIVKIIE
ncbi:MAG: LysM peptidoglycan-binding domain-containing protein, partial [Anaerotignum sp.]|nr:LysM peptidoglycan-binding domain-containing protein [Anaerotignum sp.]